MKDDRKRLVQPLKNGWSQFLEMLLDPTAGNTSQEKNQSTLQISGDELRLSLQQLSQLRHKLNCRLESIKREVESLQIKAAIAGSTETIKYEQLIFDLGDEGYELQVELKDIETLLKRLRQIERCHQTEDELAVL